jgi:hypothetical protein
MSLSPEIQERLKAAVQHFWGTRETQSLNQISFGRKDAGARSAVTGGPK